VKPDPDPKGIKRAKIKKETKPKDKNIKSMVPVLTQ
jgi:hypothetical protein